MIKILVEYMKQYLDVSEERLYEMAKDVPIKSYKKGSVLISQGDITQMCFFVIKGCLRLFRTDENGKETTLNFLTENDVVSVHNGNNKDLISKYEVICLEDCILVEGDLSMEQDMYDKFNELETMTRKAMESQIGSMQDAMVTFMGSSPEERYKHLLDTRPDLLDRVSKKLLANYLGVAPESYSRIKRRIDQRHLRLVD